LEAGQMAGRHAKPIQLHMQDGNKRHLTKAEIEQRKNSEVRLGDKKLKCPDFVKSDIAAYKKWKELICIYKDVDFVSSGDIGMLSRYCMTYGEYLELLKQKKRIERFEIDYEQLLAHFNPELLEGLDAFFKFGPVMQLDSAINKKMDQLTKMEDRLFLNPVSKIKNVPKKIEKEQVDENAAMFD
jgi:phage terminase small subunit